MSSPSSSPSFSTSPTLLPMAYASPQGLTYDELVERMRVVPDPCIPLVPTRRHCNAYFAFLASFRTAVYAAIPGAAKHQRAITREAGRRWHQCDGYTKMYWTLHADASNFPKDRNAAPSSYIPSGITSWNPYSFVAGPTFSTSYTQHDSSQNVVLPSTLPLPPLSLTAFPTVFPVWNQFIDPTTQDSFGLDVPVADLSHTPSSPYSSNLFNFQEPHFAAAASYSTSDAAFDYASQESTPTLVGPSPAAFFTGAFESLPVQASLDTPSPPTSLKSYATLKADDELFDILAFDSFDAELTNALWLDVGDHVS